MTRLEKLLTNQYDRNSIVRMLQHIDLSEPKKITIEDAKTNRSSAQNKLLWLWNNEFQRFMRDTYGQIASADDWHDILVGKLCPMQVNAVKLPDGESFNIGRARTSKFKVNEMTEYLELLDMYCAENGLILSHPSDLINAAYGRRAA